MPLIDAHDVFMLGGGSSGPSLTEVFRDEFTTNYASGTIVDPLDTSPSGYQWEVVPATGGGSSISSGTLIVGGSDFFYTPVLTRTAGRMLRMTLAATGRFFAGWHKSQTGGTYASVMFRNASQLTLYMSDNTATEDTGSRITMSGYSGAVDQYVMIMLATGMLYLTQDAGTVKLLAVSDDNANDMAGVIRGQNQDTFTEYEIQDISGWNDADIKMLEQVSPTASTDYEATDANNSSVGDGLFWLESTLPVSPVNGDHATLYYRTTDLNNTMRLRIIYNTSQWDMELHSIVGGVATLRASSANVGSNINLIGVLVDGGTHTTFRRNEPKNLWLDMGFATSVTLNSTETTCRVASTNVTLDTLTAYPVQSSIFDGVVL